MSRFLLALGSLMSCCAVAIACSQSAAQSDESASEDAIVTGVTLPALGPRIDRIGRPEVTNFLIRDPKLKAVYNGDDAFALPKASAEKYAAAIRTTLALYDSYDGTADMSDATLDQLAQLLVDDTLHIDLSMPCAGASSTGYLDLERATLGGEPAASCGGRSPNEDAFDTAATLYTNGPSKPLPRVTDLVDQSTGIAAASFPYLAKPHLLRTPTPAVP